MRRSLWSFYILLALTISTSLFADHTLGDAMSRSFRVKLEVDLIQQEHNVVCNVDNSSQAYYYPAEIGQPSGGTAWKQIALCYTQVSIDENGYPYFNDLHLTGVLVVGYTWVDYAPGELLTISYQ